VFFFLKVPNFHLKIEGRIVNLALKEKTL